MNMKNIKGCLLLAGLLLLPTGALAQDTADLGAGAVTPGVSTPAVVKVPVMDHAALLRAKVTQAQIDKVKLLLSGYEFFPTREDLERATPMAAQVLMHIAEDEEALPSMRLRAVDALGFFQKEDKVALYFEAALQQEHREAVYLRHTVTSSLRAFGQQALPWVQPFLTHQNLQVRLSAVHALGRFGGDEGLGMLRVQHDLEQDVFVREQLQKFIR